MEDDVFNKKPNSFAKRFEIFLTESEDERCMLNTNSIRYHDGC